MRNPLVLLIKTFLINVDIFSFVGEVVVFSVIEHLSVLTSLKPVAVQSFCACKVIIAGLIPRECSQSRNT